jgi:hypothetical protein
VIGKSKGKNKSNGLIQKGGAVVRMDAGFGTGTSLQAGYSMRTKRMFKSAGRLVA